MVPLLCCSATSIGAPFFSRVVKDLYNMSSVPRRRMVNMVSWGYLQTVGVPTNNWLPSDPCHITITLIYAIDRLHVRTFPRLWRLLSHYLARWLNATPSAATAHCLLLYASSLLLYSIDGCATYFHSFAGVANSRLPSALSDFTTEPLALLCRSPFVSSPPRRCPLTWKKRASHAPELLSELTDQLVATISLCSS